MGDAERDPLLGKLHALERQLAQAVRREIDIERESQDALSEAENFRSAAQEREADLVAQLATAKLDQDKLTQELSTAKIVAETLRSSSGQHDRAIQQKQQEVLAIRETNRQLDSKVEQLQSFLQEQAASNKQARTTIMELTRERGELDMRAMRAESQLRQCQHAKQNADMDKDILQKDVASLQQQLAEKSEALRAHWTESNAKVHALEHQLQETSSQRQVLDASHAHFQQQRDRLVEQLRKAQSDCQSTQSLLEQRQALFEEESSSLHTALSRHKDERAALEHDKQGLHSFVQELTKKAEAFKHEHEQALGQLQRQLSSAKQGLAERDDIIQRFKQVSANDGVPSLATALHENQAMSPGPSQNGTSPVQVYSKYVALSQEHNKLRREHQKLQAEWEQFEQAVIPEAQKAKQLARRNVDLDEANAKLSAQVQVSNEKAKRCLDSVHKWQGQYDEERAAHGVTRKLLKEAQHQVALLANENRQLNGIREQGIMPAWSSGLLDQSLVQFRDVQGLVTTNETLRRLLHEQQLKGEQQMKQLQLEVQAREKQIMKGYEEPLAAARQQNAEAVARMQHLIQQRDAAQKAAREAQRSSTPSDAPQRVPPQQLKSVHELEQELARLRYEGQTYQDDLKKQLEGARQAAMQARHEAGQAHARATHEASLVSQLQDDKKRLSDIVDSWKRQGREQQELISGLNRRLDQLQSHASRAQDESGNLRQRVAVLNAQHEILQRENQRLLHESTEHSTARWQLVAQRDAADRMSQQLQDQESSQRARLHSELTTLQRDLAEVQRQLAEERSSHQHSFSSVQTVQEAADARLTQVEQGKDKLQEALTEAQSQLAVSEAKVVTLQASVQQAEARTAALELQLKPKASSDAGASGPSGSDTPQSTAALRKELQEAQSQAAQEAGHVAQFKSLAESAEENTSIIQSQYERLKAEAEQTTEQLHQAQRKLEGVERDLNSERQSAYEAAQLATHDKQQAHATITNLQAELVIAKRHAEADTNRHQKTVQELASRTEELRQAQTSYNKSVLEHAETVKKLSEHESQVHQLQVEQASHMASREEAYRSKAAAELAWQKERAGLQEARAAAQRRSQDLERVNAELQVHLDRSAHAAAGQTPNQEGQLAGLVQHLQRRARTLEGEASSLQQVVARLKADLEASNSRVTQAEQARIEVAERLKDSLRSQEHQQRLMQQVQELNLLRESNVTLRSMSEQHRREAESASGQVQHLQAELDPLRRRANELQAAVDSHQQDNAIHEEAMQHAQKRISDLLQKADAVDKVEHERVTAALKAAEKQLTTAQAEVDRLKPLQASVSKLTEEAELMQAKLTAVQAELGNKQATIDKQKNNVSIASNMIKSINPDGLKAGEWRISMTQKLERLKNLEQSHSELQQVQASNITSNELLKQDMAAVQAELTQLRQEAKTTGASTKEMQAQHQVLQSSEQNLHLRVKALDMELTQKSTRLEQTTQQQQQLQEQLNKANADLNTSSDHQEQATKQLAELKIELDNTKIELSAKSAQLETTLKSMQTQASTSDQEQQDSAQKVSQEHLQKELQLQQAQAALQQEQSQIAHRQELLQQQQQQHQERQQQLQQQQQALEAAQLDLQTREADVNAKAGQVSDHAPQVQGNLELQLEVQQLRQQVADLERKVGISQAALQKSKADVSSAKATLAKRGEMLNRAICSTQAKQAVAAALMDNVKSMSAQLAEASLPVPDEIDTDTIFKTSLEQCLAEKGSQASKRTAADAKGAKQAAGTAAAQRARVAAGSSLQSISTAAKAASRQSSPIAGPTPEELAVRNAALASLHKGQEGAAPVSPRQPQPKAVLKMRSTVQQVAKRDRAEPQEVASRSDPSRTASDMPAAKRVKGDDATATPSPPAPAAESEALPSDSEPQVTQSVPEPIAISLSHQAETASEMRLDLPHQQQQQTALAADGASLEDQPNVVAPAGLQLRPNQTAAATAMQDSVARVVVVHDHIEVSIQASSIDMPAAEASLAQAGGPAVQPEASPQPTTQPSAVQPEAGSADTADVAMTEATSVADELAPLVKMERQGLEAEDGELAHAAAAAEAMTNADEQAPQAETAAATTAGQDEAGDGDRAGGQKRPPIVFQLPTSVAVESPTPAASGQQPQTEQQQQQAGGRGLRGRGTGASGRGGTAAGASVRNAARGGRKQR